MNPSAIAADPSIAKARRLVRRWRNRDRFVALEAGCGGAQAFLAVWQAWRGDAHACERLTFVSVTAEPLPAAALRASLPGAGSAWPELTDQLIEAWPRATANLHRLGFDDGRVQLLLIYAPLADALAELAADVDAFWFGAIEGVAPRRLAKALARLAASDATLTITPAFTATHGPLGAALHAAGFQVTTDGATLAARFAPVFVPRRAPARRTAHVASERHALIVGGGLAGCAAAWALAEHGWRITLLERHATVAQEASGNPAGLFHGIVNRQDSTHARFNRAAALEAQRVVQAALARGVAGQQQGLLRLQIDVALESDDVPQKTNGAPNAYSATKASPKTRLGRAEQTLAAMEATLHRLRLPPDYVQALSADAAGARAGLPLGAPAWFYPGGGWIDPAGLARHYLERAGVAATWRGGCTVAALRHAGAAWEVLDAKGHAVACAQTVVLANAVDALRLLGSPNWPITAVRGQISVLHDAAAFGWRLPKLPLTGAGYLLPEVRGCAIWGATAQPDDFDPAVRADDHEQNLAQLARLLGTRAPIGPQWPTGRTAWRCVSDDRLPVVGAVPVEIGTAVLMSSGGSVGPAAAAQSTARPPDQPRHVPRLTGLYVCTGFGSRGITWSALAAQVLASIVSGAPVPLEASLLDAIDPARFVARRNRRATGNGNQA